MLCEAAQTNLGAATSASRPRLRPVGPKLTPLLCIQKSVIVERRGGRPINSTTGSIITNRVDRSTCREPLAFKRNTLGVVRLQLQIESEAQI